LPFTQLYQFFDTNNLPNSAIKFYNGTKKMSNEEQTTFNMRVGRTLVEQFKKAAKENNRTASQLLRDCMIDYVKEHRQSTLKE